jgi:ferrous iron transport protein B
VGNWSGVTVEKKEALIEYDGRQIRLVDLPATYSLSPYAQEEIIARDYLVREKPDVIIDVIDATNLERKTCI